MEERGPGVEINREAVQTFFVGIEINIELLKHCTMGSHETKQFRTGVPPTFEMFIFGILGPVPLSGRRI